MEKYTDRYHPDYIPGTYSIYASSLSNTDNKDVERLKTRNGVILLPQPTDSPNDPLNWHYWRKAWHFLLVTFITAFSAAISNDAGAAQDSLNEIYGISYDAMNTGAGVLFLAIGYGTWLMAPFSSLYGRKLTYIICCLSGLAGCCWFASSKTTADTIWSQLFVGASESVAEAQVQLSLSDLFFRHQLGSVMTVYILATSIGTYLGPLIAGFISSNQNFRWVGWWGAIISGILFVFILFGYEDTMFDYKRFAPTLDGESAHAYYSNQIDEALSNALADEQQGEKGRAVVKIPSEKLKNQPIVRRRALEMLDSNPPTRVYPDNNGADDKQWSYWRRIQIITKGPNLRGWGIKQYFQLLWMNCRVFFFPPVILSGLMWGSQDAFLSFYLTTEDTEFYDAPWNYSDAAVAIMNVPCLIGAVIGCLYAGSALDYFVLWMARRNGGVVEAEFRLYFAFLSGIICPAGLLMFGIGTARQLDWRVIYVGLGFVGFGWGCSGDIAMSYLMDSYPEMVLEGMVGVAVINNTISCIFTFTCSDWLNTSGTEKTYIALAILNFTVMFLALPFIVWGRRMRAFTKKYYVSFIEMRDGI